MDWAALSPVVDWGESKGRQKAGDGAGEKPHQEAGTRMTQSEAKGYWFPQTLEGGLCVNCGQSHPDSSG